MTSDVINTSKLINENEGDPTSNKISTSHKFPRDCQWGNYDLHFHRMMGSGVLLPRLPLPPPLKHDSKNSMIITSRFRYEIRYV